ncbi:MAG: chemotaxis protein CheW [Clostridiales bacterium]
MRKYLTFSIENNIYGVDLELVKEISSNVKITLVDYISKGFLGLLNLRGNVISIFQFYFLYNRKQKFSSKLNKLILLKKSDKVPEIFGFVVDEVLEIIDFDEEFVNLDVLNTGIPDNSFIKKVICSKNNVFIIDIEKFINKA